MVLVSDNAVYSEVLGEILPHTRRIINTLCARENLAGVFRIQKAFSRIASMWIVDRQHKP